VIRREGVHCTPLPAVVSVDFRTVAEGSLSIDVSAMTSKAGPMADQRRLTPGGSLISGGLSSSPRGSRFMPIRLVVCSGT
jgi:hypothetical protein